jgi:hypothetical protein
MMFIIYFVVKDLECDKIVNKSVCVGGPYPWCVWFNGVEVCMIEKVFLFFIMC